MTTRYIKRCSISLIIRKIQTKTIVRYHLTTVRMAITLKPLPQITSLGKDKEKKGGLCSVDVTVNCCCLMENSMKVPQKIKNRTAK